MISYQVNDTVLYGSHGICRIREITTKKVADQVYEYYVLAPIYDENSTIYVPIKNENLTRKMRYVLTEAEIHQLLRETAQQEEQWIENEMQRKNSYREVLDSGNCAALVLMSKTLHQHQKNLVAVGKRLHASDAHFLKAAEKIINEELAHVLGIRREQVLSFILEQTQQETMACVGE